MERFLSCRMPLRESTIFPFYWQCALKKKPFRYDGMAFENDTSGTYAATSETSYNRDLIPSSSSRISSFNTASFDSKSE